MLFILGIEAVHTGCAYRHTMQGRRRLSKSGPAMKHQRHFTSVEDTSWGRAREEEKKKTQHISGRP